MKLWWRILAFILLAGIWIGAPIAVRRADEIESGMPRQESWNGTVTCGIVNSFPTVSVNRWLKNCFSDFAAAESGRVLVELKELTAIGVEKAAAAGTLPDVLLFGQNVLGAPETLLEPAPEMPQLRQELRGLGGTYAAPIAEGGYVLLGNRALLESAGWSDGMTEAQTAALLRENGLTAAAPQMNYTDPASCIGAAFPVETRRSHTQLWAEFVLDQRHALYAATQRELIRMEALQKAGRGFETVVLVPEEPVTDQVLLFGIVRPELTARQSGLAQRRACIERLREWLLSDAAQGKLDQAVLFPVTESGWLYEAETALGRMERSLRGARVRTEENRGRT